MDYSRKISGRLWNMSNKDELKSQREETLSPIAKWTAKSVSNSNGVTTQMAMWKRIAILKCFLFQHRREKIIAFSVDLRCVCQQLKQWK